MSIERPDWKASRISPPVEDSRPNDNLRHGSDDCIVEEVC